MTTITIDGMEFPIRPTPAPKIWPALGALQRDPATWSAEDWDRVTEAMFWGIRRAGGEITLEWLRTNLDIRNLVPSLKSFAEANSLETEGSGAGEAAGAAPTP